MTVSTTLNKAQFDGSGSTGPFTFNFRFLDNSHIVVIKTASSVDTTLTETTDYTLTGAGSYSGGSITLDTALAVGETLTVYRYVPYTQSTDFRNQSAFFAELHEDQFDILTMQAQQLAEAVERSVKVPITSDETPDDYLLTEIQAAATDAASSASEAAGYLDQFTDLYLGSHATEPATDNDGNALAEGAVYWNSTEKNHYTHDGSVWVPWGGNPPDGDKGDVVVSSSGAVWTVQSAEACTGNAATATAAQTNAFRTATSAAQSSIGAKIIGYDDCYLYNNTIDWGLYSTTGGTMCAYNRAAGTHHFYGNAATATTADGLASGADLSGLTQFARSLATNGYQKLPSGLILQWGVDTRNTDSAYTLLFAITFPNACFGVFVNRQTPDKEHPMSAAAITTSSFQIDRCDAIDGTETINWFAIGY